MRKKLEPTKSLDWRMSLPLDTVLSGSDVIKTTTHKSESKDRKVKLDEKSLYFDKSLKENIKYPSGYWKKKRE